jgi:hypothetical protein
MSLGATLRDGAKGDAGSGDGGEGDELERLGHGQTFADAGCRVLAETLPR